MAKRNGMTNGVLRFYRNNGSFSEEDLVFNQATGKYESMSISRIKKVADKPGSPFVTVRRCA